VAVGGGGGLATLKAAPDWWTGAPGVRRCQDIEDKFGMDRVDRPTLRKLWHKAHCVDYTTGDRLIANRTNLLVFDVGFHSGDDSLYFLERGHDVVAVDANPTMIEDGRLRPAMRVAERMGRFHGVAKGVLENVQHANQTLSFFLHRTVSEWSTFNTPSPTKMQEFDRMLVPLTTCAALMREFGTPFYLKVDIEGLDKACLASLQAGSLPKYVSTEDPLQLDHLVSLRYRSFKMVSQARTRRGGRQFSGGMPEETPGPWGPPSSIRAHPFFSTAHMHVRIDAHGNRIREEHDLHARLAP
jgi:FkbM family methyltransferase